MLQFDLKLSDVKIRYFYTIDSEDTQNFAYDWCSIDIGTTGQFVKLTPPRNGADHYVRLVLLITGLSSPLMEAWISG